MTSPSGSPSLSSTCTARPAGRDHDVVTDRRRWPVLGGRPDLDADLGDVGLLAVGRRVVEDEGARCVGVEEQLAVGRQRHVEGADRAVDGTHERGLLGDEERVVVGVGVVGQDVETDRLADHGDAGVVAGVGLVLASSSRTDTITVASAVAPKSSLTVYVSSMRSCVVFGSGVNTTCPDGSGTISPAVLPGSLRAIESSTRASPSGSVSLASTSNVVGRPRRVEAMSLWASGGRFELPSERARRRSRWPPRSASRPSVIV